MTYQPRATPYLLYAFFTDSRLPKSRPSLDETGIFCGGFIEASPTLMHNISLEVKLAFRIIKVFIYKVYNLNRLRTYMIEENHPKTYPRWVGVLLSFILAGSSQFISGKRSVGVIWCISLCMLGGLSDFVLAIPLGVAVPIFIILSAICLILWIIMLKQSYRHIRRIRFNLN